MAQNLLPCYELMPVDGKHRLQAVVRENTNVLKKSMVESAEASPARRIPIAIEGNFQ